MFFLAVVETRDLICVFLVPLLLASDFDRVDSGGRGNRIFEFFEVPLVFILLLFLVFAGLIGKLGLLDGSGSLKSLGVIPMIYR